MNKKSPLNFDNVSYVLRVKDGKFSLVADVPSMEHAAEVVRRIAVSSGSVNIGIEVFNSMKEIYEARESISINSDDSFNRNQASVSNSKPSMKDGSINLRKVITTSLLIFCGIAPIALHFIKTNTSDLKEPILMGKQGERPSSAETMPQNSVQSASGSIKPPAESKDTFYVGLRVTAMLQRMDDFCEMNFDINNQSSYDMTSMTFKFDLKNKNGKVIDIGHAASGFVSSYSEKSESKLFRVNCNDVEKIVASVTTSSYSDDSLPYGSFSAYNVVIKSLSGSILPFVAR